MKTTLRNTDIFAAVNLVGFAAMSGTVYYHRYLHFMVVGNLDEFLLYAAAILAAVVLAWRYLREVPFPNWVLLLMQVGIFAHFAGGFVPMGGGRLYDAVVLGLPFDKYVHAFNAIAGGAVASQVIEPPRRHPNLRFLIILLVVQGGGALVEIVEYVAKMDVSGSGVGDYDNNMQDLVANFVGGVLFLGGLVVAPRLVARLRAKRSSL